MRGEIRLMRISFRDQESYEVSSRFINDSSFFQCVKAKPSFTKKKEIKESPRLNAGCPTEEDNLQGTDLNTSASSRQR